MKKYSETQNFFAQFFGSNLEHHHQGDDDAQSDYQKFTQKDSLRFLRNHVVHPKTFFLPIVMTFSS